MNNHAESPPHTHKAKKKTRIFSLLLKKFGQFISVLLAVSFLSFVFMELAPGDPGTALYEAAGLIPTEEMLALTREQLGLNEPFWQRYFQWLGRCLQGDLGTSFSQHDEVLRLITRNMKSTCTLAFLILAVTLVISLPLGILSATMRGKFPDYLIGIGSFVCISAPNFLVALILTYVFCAKLSLLPVYNPYGSQTALILPVMTLAIGMIGNYTRQIRALVLEELSQGYVYGARARGLGEGRILFFHVLRNTMLPLLTLVTYSLGSLLGGVAIVEAIFSFPGLGNLMIYAVDMRDYPLIQGLVLWIACCYTLLNIVTDMLYQVIDPRLGRDNT